MALNFLIVDDSSVMRRMIRRCIELAELPVGEIHEGGNGREGLAIINRAWVDIVIADINMPVMDGVEMITELRREPATRHLPVVVVSTESSETRVSLLEGQGVTFVHKPFHPEDFRQTILRLAHGTPANGLDDVLARTAERVFAELTYVFAVGADEVSPRPSVVWAARVVVKFAGPRCGQLTLVVSRELMKAVCVNMLALEPDAVLTMPCERDAACELASVICGNVVATLGNPQAVFRLSPPELAMPAPGEVLPAVDLAQATAHAALTLDVGDAELWLSVADTSGADA